MCWLVFAQILALYIVLQNALTCITQYSSYSATNDDALTYVECDAEQTLVSCFCAVHYDGRFDGCFVKEEFPNRCYARNGAGGGKAQAEARCCSSTDLECIPVNGDSYKFGLGRQSIKCPTSHPHLTGCSAQSPWASMDGAFPGIYEPIEYLFESDTNYAVSDYCTAYNGVPYANKGTKAHAVCCKAKHDTEDLNCVVRYGPMRDDATGVFPSVTECSYLDGYKMTGCFGWCPYNTIQSIFHTDEHYTGGPSGHYIEDSGCVARGQNVRAVAICCKLEMQSSSFIPRIGVFGEFEVLAVIFVILICVICVLLKKMFMQNELNYKVLSMVDVVDVASDCDESD